MRRALRAVGDHVMRSLVFLPSLTVAMISVMFFLAAERWYGTIALAIALAGLAGHGYVVHQTEREGREVVDIWRAAYDDLGRAHLVQLREIHARNAEHIGAMTDAERDLVEGLVEFVRTEIHRER